MYDRHLYEQEMMLRMHVVDRQQELLESLLLGRWTARFGGGTPATGMPMLTTPRLLYPLPFVAYITPSPAPQVPVAGTHGYCLPLQPCTPPPPRAPAFAGAAALSRPPASPVSPLFFTP